MEAEAREAGRGIWAKWSVFQRRCVTIILILKLPFEETGMLSYMRGMRREDIAQVAEIDREAFPTEWPPPNFKRELQNRLAHYVVVCDAEMVVDTTEGRIPPKEGFVRLIPWIRKLFGGNRFSSSGRLSTGQSYVTGFAGLWVMADEAHITTIASRKAHRKQGIGELLLIVIVETAMKLNARIITLEVRVSNTAAHCLYFKYGFTQVGLRRGYYMDNKEDAIIMSTDNIASKSFQVRLKQLKEAHSMKWGIPGYKVEN